jgi:hypothetical protein
VKNNEVMYIYTCIELCAGTIGQSGFGHSSVFKDKLKLNVVGVSAKHS